MSQEEPKLGKFCWNELVTPDTKKSRAFYQALFGWEFEEMDVGEWIYTMIKSATEGVGGMLQIPEDKKEVITPHWMSYVYVEKVDDAVKKAESLGAKVLVPATNISDYGRFAVIQDPVGAVLAVWESLKQCG